MQFNVMIIVVIVMKKIILILIGVLFVACLVIFAIKFRIFNIREALQNKIENDSGEIQKDDKSSTIFNNTYEEIVDYISGDDNYMLIIGKKGCYFCDIYKPIVEDVSSEYNFNYLFIDVLAFSNEDKQSFFNSEIKIPGKCRDDGNDAYLYEGFGTPLTLFIHNKTSYDCIRGYVDKDNLISKLKEISFIN